MYPFIILSAFFACGYYLIRDKIPDKVRVSVGSRADFDLDLPLTAKTHVEDVSVVSIDKKPLAQQDIILDLSTPFTVELSEAGSFEVNVQFLGITLKKIDVEAVSASRVMPVGEPVGIHIRTNGVMVLGTRKKSQIRKEIVQSLPKGS